MNNVTAMNENIQLLIRAMSVTELLEKLQQPQAPACSANPAEWMQLSKFLKSCAFKPWLAYPLSVYRDQDVGGVPDFTIEIAEESAGVELTTLTNSPLEQSRVDQRRLDQEGIQLGARAVGSLKLDDHKRTLDEIREETLCPSPEKLPPTVGQLDDAWLSNIMGRIEKKTRGMSELRYRHGNQGWLVLQDRLSTSRDVEGRIGLLKGRLELYWSNTGTFHRIFVQSRDFDTLFMLTSLECVEVVLDPLE